MYLPNKSTLKKLGFESWDHYYDFKKKKDVEVHSFCIRKGFYISFIPLLKWEEWGLVHEPSGDFVNININSLDTLKDLIENILAISK